MTLRPLPLLAALPILALLAGCGSDSGGGDLCGCTEATAQDLSTQSTVTVNFGGQLGNAYDPQCIVVAPGTSVSFEGTFATHPLSPTSGAGNPMAATTAGTTAAFTFSQPGTFGYQCDVHVGAGMCGAVFVR